MPRGKANVENAKWEAMQAQIDALVERVKKLEAEVRRLAVRPGFADGWP